MVKQKKVRVIRSKRYEGDKALYGISLFDDIGTMQSGTYFNITTENSCKRIVLESGTKVEYSKEEIENFKFE